MKQNMIFGRLWAPSVGQFRVYEFLGDEYNSLEQHLYIDKKS